MIVTGVDHGPRLGVTCTQADATGIPADLLLAGASPLSATNPPPGLSGPMASYRAMEYAGEVGEDLLVTRRPEDAFAATQVMVVGIGETLTAERCQQLGLLIGRHHPKADVVTDIHMRAADPVAAALALVRGLGQGGYRFDHYRGVSAAEGGPAALTFASTPADLQESLSAALVDAQVVEDAVVWARDLTNLAAGDLLPTDLGRQAAGLAGGALSVMVHEEDWLREQGFAGLLSVSAGSANPCCLIEATYRGPDAGDRAPLIIVGKGITFDSGGLSLKKAENMIDMKTDMGGGAAALAALRAVADLAPPSAYVKVYVPAAENLPGPHATHPGDVLTHLDGRTTEVVNTDCEGRLVMSDVVAWAARENPMALVTVATLTYSAVAALGTEITAVLGDRGVCGDLIASSEAVGEPMWELPMWTNYLTLMTSMVADLRNEENVDAAAAIVGGLYLQQFAAGVRFAHIDIGGTAYLEKASDRGTGGATGVMVRTLIEFILRKHT